MSSRCQNARAHPLLFLFLTAVLCSARLAGAQQVAEPTPDHKFDVAYWTAVGSASLGVALDAYTTITSIGPGKRCNAEVESPGLYGRVPTPARTIVVMGAQLGAAILVSRELRRRSRGKNMRRLTLLLGAANAVHFAGAIHNERACQ